MAAAIGADWLIYQDIEDLIEAARAGNPAITRFDTSCFTGDYVTGDVSADYLEHISAMRSDSARQARETDDDTVIDLSNHA